jgi:hypothetical protein
MMKDSSMEDYVAAYRILTRLHRIQQRLIAFASSTRQLESKEKED